MERVKANGAGEVTLAEAVKSRIVALVVGVKLGGYQLLCRHKS